MCARGAAEAAAAAREASASAGSAGRPCDVEDASLRCTITANPRSALQGAIGAPSVTVPSPRMAAAPRLRLRADAPRRTTSHADTT